MATSRTSDGQQKVSRVASKAKGMVPVNLPRRAGAPRPHGIGGNRMAIVLSAGETITVSGGRVLGVTAVAADLTEARERAYVALRCIQFPG
eukprot:847496-Amphidinium_carterae.1